MTEPIDELLEWLHTFDELQFSCNHRNVIEKIWQIKSKQQLTIHSVVVPKGTLCDEICCENEATHIAYTEHRYNCEKHRQA